MDKSYDIFSVAFLALVAIVVASLVNYLTPNNMQMLVPTFAIIAVILWMIYDQMLMIRHSAKKKCSKSKSKEGTIDDLVDEINNTTDEPTGDSASTNASVDVSTNASDKPNTTLDINKESDTEFDIDLYNGKSIPDMYSNMGCDGDNAIANRMKYMSLQPQLSKNIRASFNKYSLQPWLEEELQEHSEREWWSSDHLDAVF